MTPSRNRAAPAFGGGHRSIHEDTSPSWTPDHAQGASHAYYPQRLSVIVPARNEAPSIGQTLDRLRHGNPHEVIVVDGGSDDDTRDVAHGHGATVIESLPSRGRQMNLGAAVATGELLLFLHADTLLPEDFDEQVRCVLELPGVSAGAFRLHIDSAERALRTVERFVHFRSKYLQMPYGDQAIFLTAAMFHRASGFPDWPVLEDYALVRRLHRFGRVAIAPSTVLTSARRWTERGIWRTTLQNQLCLAAHFLGVSPNRIARWRYRQ